MCPFMAVLLWTAAPAIETSGEESEDSTHHPRSVYAHGANVQVGALTRVRQFRGNVSIYRRKEPVG